MPYTTTDILCDLRASHLGYVYAASGSKPLSPGAQIGVSGANATEHKNSCVVTDSMSKLGLPSWGEMRGA